MTTKAAKLNTTITGDREMNKEYTFRGINLDLHSHKRRSGVNFFQLVLFTASKAYFEFTLVGFKPNFHISA